MWTSHVIYSKYSLIITGIEQVITKVNFISPYSIYLKLPRDSIMKKLVPKAWIGELLMRVQ